MTYTELMELLNIKESPLIIEKTNHRNDRVTIKYYFEKVNGMSEPFWFRDHSIYWVLSVINCIPCKTIIK